MCCWFCESPLRSGPEGIYCPFAPCPACKTGAGGALLDGAEPCCEPIKASITVPKIVTRLE
jgi:hypothetical protein